jgi:hypothetical protein
LQKQTNYTLGTVAKRLICKEKKSKDSDKEKLKLIDKIDLQKLPLLHGGFDTRFIPIMSKKTKDLIEGFFKITQDEELRKYALQEPSDLVKTENDELLERVIEVDPEVADENEVDYVELTIEVLQQFVTTKIPLSPICRIGGVDGMRLARASFAVILKF